MISAPPLTLDAVNPRPAARAGERAAVRVLRLPASQVVPRALFDDHPDRRAVLVLDGLMVLELGAGRRRVAWLIGTGDLICAGQLSELALATQSRWQALTNTRLALLDGGYRHRIAAHPARVDKLMAHAAATTHWLLTRSLVMSSPSAPERLLSWFTLAAQRWGKVIPHGVTVQLPLTHELLGALIGARRPTVSLALKQLRSGRLTRTAQNTWLVRSKPHHRASDPKTATPPRSTSYRLTDEPPGGNGCDGPPAHLPLRAPAAPSQPSHNPLRNDRVTRHHPSSGRSSRARRAPSRNNRGRPEFCVGGP